MQPLEADDPRVIGPYRLLMRLGAGGMGRVYLGRSAGGRTVAVKVVHAQFAADEEFRARFLREVEAARRVGGQWTAPVLEADPRAAVPWVATGYVAGPALGQAVSAFGPLPEHTVRTLGAGLAEALAAVHTHGLVHRDVKPSNVLLTLDGPRLIDFGIARATDSTTSLTATGASIGSPGYMAPEQILGRGAAAASDVFSLGAVLAFAALGEGPFPGDSSAALLYRVVHEEPRLDGLQGEMHDLVAACLAKEPQARPAPDEIARRLVPDGDVPAAVRTGWLPAPVVEQVSRRAVELLSLDAEPAVVPAQPGPGPVAPLPAEPHPPADSAPRVPAEHGAYEHGAPASGNGTPPGVYGPPHPFFADPAGATGAAVPAPRRPRFSLSATTSTTEPTAADRSRRLSCSLVLSVAAALAVGTSMAFFLHLVPGSGDGDHTGAADHGDQTPAATAPTAQIATVPAGYLGRWQGAVTTDSGVPGSRLKVTVHAGKVGQDVAEARQSVLGYYCTSKWRLRKATGDELELESRLIDARNESTCSARHGTVRLSLNPEGTLHYEEADQAGGNPTADLAKDDTPDG